MKVAIPTWQGRVSPVFDVAGSLRLVEVADARAVGRQDATLTATDPLERARQVRQCGADVLICGAISWPLEMALTSAGVRVIAQTCGPVEDVLDAFLAGRLDGRAFRMPGCCGRRRRRGCRRRNQT